MADGEKTIYTSKQWASTDKPIENAVFADITSDSHGTAIQVNSGVVATITGTTFSGNSATGSDKLGGAIYIAAGGAANISGSTFTENYAGRRGGAINSRGTLTVSDSVFDSNTANTASGAAIYVTSAGSLTLSGAVTFLTSTDKVYSAGAVTITNATVNTNADLNFGSNTATVTASTFNFGNTTAISIGGLSFTDPANCSVNFTGTQKVTFAADQSLADVAVTVDGANYILTGTYTIAENAGDVSGEQLKASDLEFISSQQLSYKNNTLTLTVESSATSAALFTADKKNYVKIGDTYYAGNEYKTFADALAATGVDAYVADGVTFNERVYDINKTLAVFNNVTVADITGLNAYGGGFYISGGSVRILNSKFDNVVMTRNSGTQYGGAIYVGNADVDVINTTFTGNKNQRGGAIAINNGGVLTVKDCTFSGNSSYAIWNLTGSTTTYTGTNKFTTAQDSIYVHSAATVSIVDAEMYMEAGMGADTIEAAAITVTNSKLYFTNDAAINILTLNFTDTASSVDFGGSQTVSFKAADGQSLKDVAITVDGSNYTVSGTYSIATNVTDVDLSKVTLNNASTSEFVTQEFSCVNNTLTLTVKNTSLSAAITSADEKSSIKIGDTWYTGTHYDSFADALAATGVDAYVADGVSFNTNYAFSKPLVVFNDVTFADITGVNINGGGLNITGGATTITDSTFSNIHITRDNSSNYYGGAIHINNAEVSVSGTEFTDCSNIRGGAIFVNNGGSLTVKDCTFSGNTWNAVWNHASSKTTYTGTNKFTTAQDGIYVNSAATVKFVDANMYMEAGMGTNNPETAAVTVTSSNLYFTNDTAISVVKLNFTDTVSSVNFGGSQTVSFNAADGQSLKDVAITIDGSAYVGAGSYIIAENVIDVANWSFTPSDLEYVQQTVSYDSENKALKLDVQSLATSAAIFDKNNSNVIQIDGTYYAGVNYNSWDDALKATKVDAYIANGVTFTEKHSVSKSLAIYNDTVFDGIVHDENTELHGGALTISGGTTRFTGATFSGNKVLQYNSLGGAIFANLAKATDAVVEISGSTFTGNYSAKRGGALNLRGNDTTSVTIADSVFDGNSNGKDTWDGDAGAIFITSGTLTLTGKLDFLTETDSVYSGSNATLNISDANITLNAALSAAKLNLADSAIIFNGGTAFWVSNLAMTGDNAFTFNSTTTVWFNQTDLSDVDITVNGALYQGETVKFAAGVSSIGDYTIAGNDNSNLMLFLENGELTLRELTVSGGKMDDYDGKGSTLMTGGEITGVFFGDKSGESRKTIDTSITSGSVGTLIGGAFVKNAAAEIGAVKLSLGDVAVSGPVYGGGYVYGDGNARPENARVTVGSVSITLYGGAAGDNTFGGVHARAYGNANVDQVNISVTGGTHSRVYAGGWAEGNAKSTVGASTVNVSGGYVDYIYGGGANGQGETYVGATTITVGVNAEVGTIFMSGRYGYSEVGTVELNWYGTSDMKRLSGVSSAGVDNAASTTVNLFSSLTADGIDFVDKFVFAEGVKLTANVEFLLGNRTEAGLADGATTFDFTTDGLTEAWDAIAGIDDFEHALFSVNGSDAVTWDGKAALAIGDYKLSYNKEEKLITLAQA